MNSKLSDYNQMILVADDDKNIRLTLRSILERNGYEVVLADPDDRLTRFTIHFPQP